MGAAAASNMARKAGVEFEALSADEAQCCFTDVGTLRRTSKDRYKIPPWHRDQRELTLVLEGLAMRDTSVYPVCIQHSLGDPK